MSGLLLIAVVVFSCAIRTSVAQSVIEDDAYFYGSSPPVYPAPKISGTGDWAAAYSKAVTFVQKLSLHEKVSLTAGTGLINTVNGCSGVISGIPRLGFPGLCLQDSGNGVARTDFVNGYPSGIHAGASWNKDLIFDRAQHMAGEFRAKGANVVLGPSAGPLGRIATGGRNWEGFSNDPYLAGALVSETISGFKTRGVITCVKHFVGNEQETNRQPVEGLDNITVAAVSANVDDKTLHEIYLWPFADAVRAGTGTILCAYSRFNNSYSCQNSKLLNGILKGELGYQGWVVTDWVAQQSGVGSALAGLDMAMPDAGVFWGAELIQAVQNGSVPVSRLDDMATRIITSWYQLGQDSGYPAPGVGLAVSLSAPHAIVEARDPASKPVLLQGAIEGHVLVKNINNALPLKNPKLLSLFGSDAIAPTQYGIAASPLDFSWAYGILSNSTIVGGGGSAAITPPYISSPFHAIEEQAYIDGTALVWDFVNSDSNGVVNPVSSACLVFFNAFSSEGADRSALQDSSQDQLVLNIAAKCKNTIVIIHNAGIRLVDQWIDNPNVTAVIFAHLPGQDSGRALVDILYGRTSPSGKLPYTVAKNESQYGDLLGPALPEGRFELFPQSDYSEKSLIDYRAFDAANIDPRFEFGFGLTYTTFSYSNLKIALTKSSMAAFPSGPKIPGGRKDLWDVVARVTADVTNTGHVTAAEVAQLYVGIPKNGPVIKQLRGFSKASIQPGATVTVTFDLLRRDLSLWDVVAQQWNLQAGDYTIYVGASSRILPLKQTLTIHR